jgi:hypothetical protein
MRNPFRHGSLEQPVAEHDSNTMDVNKAVEAGHPPVVDVKHPVDSSDTITDESFTANAQDGVKKMEATTTVWDKNSLIAAYIMSVRRCKCIDPLI